MKINNNQFIIAFVAAMLVGTAAISAQTAGSPYSKFGYGLLDDNATAAQKQMGGVGYAMNSGRQINVKNPASYAFCDSLTFLFDMGVDLSFRNSHELASGDIEASKESKVGGGLDYITLQVPIGKRFGASAGLLPYSTVGYAFGTEITHGHNSREGSGGINQLYLGFAGKIVGNLSVGANFSYLFGNVINDIYTTTSSSNQSLFESVTEIRDWHVEAGLQYVQKLNADNKICLGLVWSPKKTLLGHSAVTVYDISQDTDPEETDRVNLKGNANLPETWGAGLGYYWQSRLLVEADFTYQPWSKAKFVNHEGFESSSFADRYRLSLGAQFTPAQRGGYLKRITYRLGGFYNRDYMMVGKNNVHDYGVGFGFGLPMISSKTMLNVGFEFRHRQASPQALIKENYFNLRLGINFNELWFFQNKLN